MKKTLLISVFLAAVLLSGCFGFFKKENAAKPAAQERAESTPIAPGMAAQNGQAAVPEPPSFQDGDVYLQALSSKDSTMCGKIQNAKLRDRCKTRVK